MGITVTKNKEHAAAIKNMQIHSGAVAAPIDCAFVLRGIKTLAIRMDRHQENAQIIAERLENHPAIARVFYPGLKNNEFHDLAKKQMRGFGGVVSVYLQDDSRSAANTVIKSLKLIQMSSSLGGVESLVNHSSSQSHSGLPQESKDKLGIREGLLRFSIGIENVEDIWADINQALNSRPNSK